jgi:hypothetical protein
VRRHGESTFDTTGSPRFTAFGFALLAVLAWAQPAGTALPSGGDAFAWLAPAVALSESERQRLEQNDVVTRTLPGGDGQVGVLVATRLDAPAEALVVWTRAITELKRGRFVLAIGRFSDPPAVSDLRDLHLDERELADISACVAG